jgi:DNA-binding NtrC family response regulator
VVQLLHRELKTVNGKERLSILHVDDDQSVLKISKQLLMDMGNFEVESSSSVDEAFQKLDKQQYDAIVSDYDMPKKNWIGLPKGVQVAEKRNRFYFVYWKG